jgi:hypothetical protein
MLAVFWAALVLPVPAQGGSKPERRLEMSEPIACRAIRGYDDYDELPEPVVPRTEKLLIYARPSGHAYVREGERYRFHLVEDVNVRRKGEKKVLWGRKRIVEYEGTSPRPPERLYIATTLGLREFPPGDYEADLILRDEIGGGEPARQTLSFRLTEPSGTSGESEDGLKQPAPPRRP